ncbi:hypothetical protein ACFSCX_00350 [Bacillus salitolerans]|uniref:Uncharacterized protein n=1 Tax=Bacillus salitolerans TaxID=1437434 RepID=A0ABW4LIC1_9BACI
MLNNKANISFDFTGDKGKAECFIFKYIEVSYSLDGSINQSLNKVNQLLNELNIHFLIENFNYNPDAAKFILCRNAAGFELLEDLESVANEIVTEIKSCTEKLASIKKINLIVDGVY